MCPLTNVFKTFQMRKSKVSNKNFLNIGQSFNYKDDKIKKIIKK